MNKSWGNDLLKSFYWIKEKRAPQHSEGYLHIPLKPSHALQLASFQVIRNYSGNLLKSRFKRIELGVTQTVHANYVFLIKVKSSNNNNNNNNNTRKSCRAFCLHCARRENLPRKYRKYICIVLCWHFCETHAVFTSFPHLWLRF